MTNIVVSIKLNRTERWNSCGCQVCCRHKVGNHCLSYSWSKHRTWHYDVKIMIDHTIDKFIVCRRKFFMTLDWAHLAVTKTLQREEFLPALSLCYAVIAPLESQNNKDNLFSAFFFITSLSSSTHIFVSIKVSVDFHIYLHFPAPFYTVALFLIRSCNILQVQKTGLSRYC